MKRSWKIFWLGIVLAIVSKIGFQVFQLSLHRWELFRCSMFAENFSCGFFGWLFNIGDSLFMVPAFIVGIIIGYFVFKNNSVA